MLTTLLIAKQCFKFSFYSFSFIIDSILNITSHLKSDLENYSIWVYLKDRIQFLPKKFKEAKLELDKV